MRRGVWCALGLALVGCGDGPDRSYTGTRDRTKAIHQLNEREARLFASSEDRFGVTKKAPPARFAYEAPPTWTPAPPTSMRDPNFTIEGGGEAYVTLLDGGGGTLLDNVNRWRGQFGQPPLTQVEVDGLPKHALFGGSATLVEAAGTFSGMRGDRADAEWALMGAMLDLGTLGGLFVKMIGPQSMVEKERDGFLSFCTSLRLSAQSMAGLQEDSQRRDEEASRAPPPKPPASLTWTLPEGWLVKDQSPGMRTVTVSPESHPEVECWVIVLAASAGGLLNNVNRWRGEVGAPPLGEGELAALERVDVLGEPAVLLKERGDYRGMGASVDGAMMLGVICPREGDTVFVKMVGPEDAVNGHFDGFVQFCQSLVESTP